MTRTYYEKKLVHCFGSSVAASLLLSFGESNDLSNREIEEAQKVRLLFEKIVCFILFMLIGM